MPGLVLGVDIGGTFTSIAALSAGFLGQEPYRGDLFKVCREAREALRRVVRVTPGGQDDTITDTEGCRWAQGESSQ